MAATPHGMIVRIEGAKPPIDDAYRRSEPDPGRLVIEHRWRDTGDFAAQVVSCVFLWAVVAVFAGVVFSPDGTWSALAILLIPLALAVMATHIVVILAYLSEPEPCRFAAEQISAYLERTGTA